MAKGDLFLGLDVGTSGVKAGLMDPAGRMLGMGRLAHENDTPHPNWVQCDPEKWWRGAVAAMAQACTDADVTLGRVASVGLSALFPVVVAMDQQGRALSPAILYSDRRSLAQVEAVTNVIPRQGYESRTGNVLTPGTCAVTSLLWLRDQRPGVYRRASCFGFANTFINFRLTGRFASDPTMLSLSGLAEIADPWQWSEDLCGKLGVEVDRLPPVHGPAQVVGGVTAAAASETGLKAGTPVVCGCGDVVASTLGAGAVSEQIALCTTGSTDSVTVPVGQPVQDRRWLNCAYVPRGLWVTVGTMSSTGVSVEWFLREVLGAGGQVGLEEMTKLAGASPPGSRGLVFLPYLQGERTPVWDPTACAMFYGISSTTTRGDLARSVFEGVALGLRQVLATLEDNLGRAPADIYFVGGATRNALWNQVKADVLQREIAILQFQETSTLGAALLAAMGVGAFDSFEAAAHAARAINRVETVRPNPETAVMYDQLYQAYIGLYPATRGLARPAAP